ncbi:MAG: hypothetical protein EZS28_012610 [Streblomastix strix]|uniref:Uncharacterized protein n=1 Tax=Streblomastix strix TaxID=222440 RepID=A0A5J4WBE6_9EUKA|nr:MAG: hypothetical protein EZS28_012610 [Streblomastix strix]
MQGNDAVQNQLSTLDYAGSLVLSLSTAGSFGITNEGEIRKYSNPFCPPQPTLVQMPYEQIEEEGGLEEKQKLIQLIMNNIEESSESFSWSESEISTKSQLELDDEYD